MGNFPYYVKEKWATLKDNICCCQVSDHSGFYFHRCKHKVKEYIDKVGFCGMHARSIKKWREN